MWTFIKCDYKLQKPYGDNTIDIYFYEIFRVKICKDTNDILYMNTFTFLNMKWFFNLEFIRQSVPSARLDIIALRTAV